MKSGTGGDEGVSQPSDSIQCWNRVFLMHLPMPSSEQNSAVGNNIAAFSASFSNKRCPDSGSKK